MGQKKMKSAKGSVSIVNHADRIRLRWRYQKQRYSLNLFQYNKANMLQAKKIALSIEHDMVNEAFDSTLNKYRPSSQKSESNVTSIVELFSEWVKQYRNRDCDNDVHFYPIKRMLERWGTFQVKDVLARLNNEVIGTKTYNERLGILKAFFIWASKGSYVDCNPLEDVRPRKMVQSLKKNKEPFSEAEIHKILEAFKNDTFCPASSRYKHSFYYPFIYFIFKMGVRNAEAIGLRVKHVDINKKVVEIREVLARTMKGTNAGARIRKETKNGKERKLPLDDKTIEVLRPLIKDKCQDALVFQSYTGLAIDDKMFQRRIFKKVLEGLSIEHRVLYACRHTFASRCINEGLTPVMTAFLLGNNPETALRNYTHLIELPKSLPPISNRNNSSDTQGK